MRWGCSRRCRYLGGCLSSYHIDDYWIERYYHHCFSGDRSLFSLIRELGLSDKLEWMAGSTGSFSRRYALSSHDPFTNPALAELSLIDKAKLALADLNAKKTDLLSLDDIPT